MATAVLRSDSAHAAAPPRHTGRQFAGLWVHALAIAVLAVLVGVLYQATFVSLAQLWNTDPRYPFGFFVPVLSLAVAAAIWRRRGPPLSCDVSAADVRNGLLVMFVGLLAHVGAIFIGQVPLDVASLVLVVRGALRIVGGRPTLQVYGAAALLPLYMIPVSLDSLTTLIAWLQSFTARGAAALLDLAGVPVFADGSILQLSDFTMIVTSASSGIRELEGVVVVSLAVALISGRGRRFCTVLVALSVPLAAGVNIVRLTAAGVAFEWRGRAAAEQVLISFDGWVIVAVATALVLATAVLLSSLTTMIPGKRMKSQ